MWKNKHSIVYSVIHGSCQISDLKWNSWVNLKQKLDCNDFLAFFAWLKIKDHSPERLLVQKRLPKPVKPSSLIIILIQKKPFEQSSLCTKGSFSPSKAKQQIQFHGLLFSSNTTPQFFITEWFIISNATEKSLRKSTTTRNPKVLNKVLWINKLVLKGL